MVYRPNGQDVEVHHGDKVITLDEQLAKMTKAIRRLEIASAILIGLVILSAILTDEQSVQFVNALLGLFD